MEKIAVGTRVTPAVVSDISEIIPDSLYQSDVFTAENLYVL